MAKKIKPEPSLARFEAFGTHVCGRRVCQRQRHRVSCPPDRYRGGLFPLSETTLAGLNTLAPLKLRFLAFRVLFPRVRELLPAIVQRLFYAPGPGPNQFPCRTRAGLQKLDKKKKKKCARGGSRCAEAHTNLGRTTSPCGSIIQSITSFAVTDSFWYLARDAYSAKRFLRNFSAIASPGLFIFFLLFFWELLLNFLKLFSPRKYFQRCKWIGDLPYRPILDTFLWGYFA